MPSSGVAEDSSLSASGGLMVWLVSWSVAALEVAASEILFLARVGQASKRFPFDQVEVEEVEVSFQVSRWEWWAGYLRAWVSWKAGQQQNHQRGHLVSVKFLTATS